MFVTEHVSSEKIKMAINKEVEESRVLLKASRDNLRFDLQGRREEDDIVLYINTSEETGKSRIMFQFSGFYDFGKYRRLDPFNNVSEARTELDKVVEHIKEGKYQIVYGWDSKPELILIEER